MATDLPDFNALLRRPEYPRSAGYDAEFVFAANMGPNVLWLTESVTELMALEPGMRVLDLGCGRAASSIFLAREFGVQVTAADLWIAPGENWGRIREAGLEGRIFPLRAEAHDLPFAEGYFDAIVSMDAFHYFGSDDLYLAYLARFLRPGGQLGMAVPGLTADIEDVPTHLAPYWEADFWSFHSPAWWRRHWQRSGAVDVETAELIPGGDRHWRDWNEIQRLRARKDGPPETPRAKQMAEWGERDRAMLEVDAVRTLALLRMVARKPA